MLGKGIYARSEDGEWIEVGVTAYADDINETNMIKYVEDAKRTIEDSTKEFQRIMEERGLAENESKAEHLVSYRGRHQAPVKN